MLHSTPRRADAAARHYTVTSARFIVIICMTLLTTIGCHKLPPDLQPCNCDIAGQGGGKSEGGKASKELAVCGVFDLPLVGITDWATNIDASLGIVPYGTYTYAELLSTPSAPLQFFSSPVLAAYTENFKYFISASVNDLNGNPLVEIQDNKWFVYVKNVGKYNYDATGFEVFDKAGHIALSFDFTQMNGGTVNLEVQGVIPTSSSTLKFYSFKAFNPELVDYQYGTPALNATFQNVYDFEAIQPIFRYTGSGWQHARLPI